MENKNEPKQYKFNPQPDITPLESVYVADVLVWDLQQQMDFRAEWELSEYPNWDVIKRHFTEV